MKSYADSDGNVWRLRRLVYGWCYPAPVWMVVREADMKPLNGKIYMKPRMAERALAKTAAKLGWTEA